MFLARVFVSLKSTISDPQGQTIQGGLHQLGFETVQSVRAGKYLEIMLDGASEAEARREIGEMCDKLLANSLIEDYRFELEPVSDG